MGPRVRRALALIAFMFALPLAAAAADAVQIVPGTAAYQNVQNALKFLREHGSGEAADELQRRLDQGKIWYQVNLDGNGETPLITGTITVNAGLAVNLNSPNVPFAPDANFTPILELARTLFHENYHSNHQDVWDSYALGSNGVEHFAWTQTIFAMEQWLHDERRKFGDAMKSARPPSAAEQKRELEHLGTKIDVLTQYTNWYAVDNEYFGYYEDEPWIDSTQAWWKKYKAVYIDPDLKRLTPIPPDPETPPAGGGTAPTPQPPKPETPKPEPPTPQPPPPPDEPVAVPCAPCQKIADQIQDVKQRLKTLNENVKKANDAVARNQQKIAALQKRVANLQAELDRAAGTGGYSYDPATGQTIEAYDQGNGTVKVTTKDAAGNVIEEHVRDSSAHKADVRRQIDEANADIAKAQAEGQNLAKGAATAKKLVNDMATLLEQLVKELEDCIKKYCSNVSTSDALNMLNLPYDSLDVLRDPTSYNPFDGNTNGAFQQMIIEIRVGNAPGMTVPRGDGAPRNGWLQDVRQPRTMLAALLSWLRPTASAWMTGARRWSAEPRRPWSVDDAEVQARVQRSPFKQPVQMLLTSLGQSTGQAFDLQVFNGSGNSFKLAAQSLVVEPLKDEVKQQVQRGMQQLIRSTANPVTAKINGYCLEMLKLPPTAGTIFKIASPQLQQRFAPMRKIMDASRRVQQLGQLRPDSNPDGYFNAIRQWSMWTVQEKLNEKTFTNAFVEHTKKLVTGQKQSWTKDAEETIKKAAPNRWNDIQKVLAAAGVPLPR